MSRARIQFEPAYILHRKPYRETSLLVEAFTREYGRIGAVARGVRKGKSRLAALIQPYQPLLLSWSGRGELHTLTGIESDGPAFLLSGSTLISGFYLNELLLRLLQRDDPHPGLFDAYVAALDGLQREEEERTLRGFEVGLLQDLGYGLNLEADAGTGEPIEPAAFYHYRLEEGPVRSTRVLPNGAVGVHGRTLIALREHNLTEPEVLSESKRLLRAALSLYLGSRPLASRSLYQHAMQRKDKSRQQEEENR